MTSKLPPILATIWSLHIVADWNSFFCWKLSIGQSHSNIHKLSHSPPHFHSCLRNPSLLSVHLSQSTVNPFLSPLQSQALKKKAPLESAAQLRKPLCSAVWEATDSSCNVYWSNTTITITAWMLCKHHAFYPLPDKIHLRTDTTFTIRTSCKKSYTLPPFPSSHLNKSKVWGAGRFGSKEKGRYIFFSHLEVCVTQKTPQCLTSASLC